MKKFNVKRMSDTDLATLYCRLERVFINKENIFYKKFEDIYYTLKDEINRRNRAKIFKVACQVLRNKNFSNQFSAASYYADAVLNDSNYFETDTSHEIRSFYTKHGNPVLVDLVCAWSKI